jgi:hypothetical protein
MNDGNTITQNKKDVLKISRKILSNEGFLIEDVRLLYKYLNNMEKNIIESNAYRIIQGIDSQTDHLPTEEKSGNYSEAYLTQLKIEKEECIKTFKDSMIKACRELIILLNDRLMDND